MNVVIHILLSKTVVRPLKGSSALSGGGLQDPFFNEAPASEHKSALISSASLQSAVAAQTHMSFLF